MEKFEEEKSNPSTDIGEKYIDLLSDSVETRNSFSKTRIMKETKRYLLSHSDVIQRYIENMDIRDRMKIISKLRKFKQDEIIERIKGEKEYTKTIFTLTIISILITCMIGFSRKDDLFIIATVIIISIITLILVSITDYMYDIGGAKKELKGIDNWYMELREEEGIIKENGALRQQTIELEDEEDVMALQVKELKMMNKKLEEEVMTLSDKNKKMELENVSRETKRK